MVTARRRTCETGGVASTRQAYDRTRFRIIADALATLPVNDLILDGEAVVTDSRGIPDFGLLHADLATGRQDRLLYYAFDLLYLDGFDLRAARLPSAAARSEACIYELAVALETKVLDSRCPAKPGILVRAHAWGRMRARRPQDGPELAGEQPD